MPGCFVETMLAGVEFPLALVLQLLAFTGAALALVGHQLTNVRDLIALIGDDVATIRGCAGIILARVCSFGGVALVVGVQPLEPSSLLVLVLRLAVHIGGLPMQLAQARIGRVRCSERSAAARSLPACSRARSLSCCARRARSRCSSDPPAAMPKRYRAPAAVRCKTATQRRTLKSAATPAPVTMSRPVRLLRPPASDR